MKVTIQSNTKVDNDLFDIIGKIEGPAGSNVKVDFKNDEVTLDLTVSEYHKKKIKLVNPTNDEISFELENNIKILKHRSQFPDRLYNHQSGLEEMIDNGLLNKNLSFKSIKDIKIGKNDVVNPQTEDWFVDDCTYMNPVKFRFIQEINIQESKYMMFYTIEISREYYEDTIESITIEKLEKLN